VEGETTTYEGHRLRAERVSGRRIGAVRLERIEQPDDDSASGGDVLTEQGRERAEALRREAPSTRTAS
jgi:hypothetical protein